MVVAGKRDNAMRLTALDERAAETGLMRGQALSDARAMHPDIEVLVEDGDADRLLVEAIADWCDRYTPLVSVDQTEEPHDFGLMLDITGCAHLFGGEKALAGDLLVRLFHQGFAANAAIAATPGAAWALARFAREDPGMAGRIVARERTAQKLAPLPLAALRLPAETLSGLARVGLRMVGQLMARPRGPLARRFGRQVLLRLDQALGSVGETISPRLPMPDLMAERRLAEPVASIQAVEKLAGRLAGHLCEDMERRGTGARILDLALFRVDGHVLRLGVGTSRPLREPEAILRLFSERLAGLAEDFDAGYGFDMVRLSAVGTQPIEMEALQFFAGADGCFPVTDLIDRLTARLGAGRVLCAVAQDTHLPEQAERLEQAFPASLTALPQPGGADLNDRSSISPVPRPLRLLARPEAIEAMAKVPDGPPVRFRWRRMLHEIARAEGPERIADEWWRSDRATRDYFRVEDRQGRRYWLFREGFYGSESNSPRWYLHGLFA